jgi:competence ComEA-like helix-hairpin-helix protein
MNYCKLAKLAFGMIFVTALPFLAGQDQTDLPDGKEKVVLQSSCASCHDLDVVVASRRTALGWRDMVDDMASRGAEVSEADVTTIVAYLTKYVGKLNVNTATQKQLQEILGLSEKEAQAIVAYHDQKGNIKDFEQLKTVPGLSAETLEKKRSLIAFTL